MLNLFSSAAVFKLADNVSLHTSISPFMGRLLAVGWLQSQTYSCVHLSCMHPSYALLLLKAAWKCMESTNYFSGC